MANPTYEQPLDIYFNPVNTTNIGTQFPLDADESDYDDDDTRKETNGIKRVVEEISQADQGSSPSSLYNTIFKLDDNNGKGAEYEITVEILMRFTNNTSSTSKPRNWYCFLGSNSSQNNKIMSNQIKVNLGISDDDQFLTTTDSSSLFNKEVSYKAVFYVNAKRNNLWSRNDGRILQWCGFRIEREQQGSLQQIDFWAVKFRFKKLNQRKV